MPDLHFKNVAQHREWKGCDRLEVLPGPGEMTGQGHRRKADTRDVEKEEGRAVKDLGRGR